VSENIHMLEYIYENPHALVQTFKNNAESINKLVSECIARSIDRIVLTGLGSSYTAAKMAEPLFQMLLKQPVYVFHSDDIEFFEPVLIDERTLLIVISRSGERGAVIDAIETGERKGAISVGVTGVEDSMLAKKSTRSLITGEGPEITFPKTKSVTACAGVLMQLGLAYAGQTGRNNTAQSAEMVQDLKSQLYKIPDKLKASIPVIDRGIKEIINQIKDCSAISVAGSISNYGVALESAVKIQEASNRFTRSDTLAGLLHGPLGAVNLNWAVLLMITEKDGKLNDDILKTANKLKARTISVYSGKVEYSVEPEFTIHLPDSTDDLLAGLLYLPVVQLMAYHWTISLGMNPDAPAAMMDILNSILPEGREEPEFRKNKGG